MKVYELVDKLMKLPAGTEVNVGIGPTLNVAADFVEDVDGNVSIRSDQDVEVGMHSGNCEWLSSLVDDSEEDG